MPHTHDSASSTWSQTHPARRIRHWTGGVEGNAQLTAVTGLLLLVLLFVEGITLLRLRALFPVHVFVGLLLVPPILLKLASTGYASSATIFAVAATPLDASWIHWLTGPGPHQ